MVIGGYSNGRLLNSVEIISDSINERLKWSFLLFLYFFLYAYINYIKLHFSMKTLFPPLIKFCNYLTLTSFSESYVSWEAMKGCLYLVSLFNSICPCMHWKFSFCESLYVLMEYLWKYYLYIFIFLPPSLIIYSSICLTHLFLTLMIIPIFFSNIYANLLQSL
jgi:hypothetical protein